MMNHLRRVAGLFFSPIPRHLRVEIAAHGCAQTPGPSSLGEDGGGSGQTPAAEALRHLAAAGTPVVTQPVTGDDLECGAGTASPTPHSPDRPENERSVASGDDSSRQGSAVVGAARNLSSFSGPPASETLVAFYPDRENRWELGDERLGLLVTRWAGELA